eukprot:872472_1
MDEIRSTLWKWFGNDSNGGSSTIEAVEQKAHNEGVNANGLNFSQSNCVITFNGNHNGNTDNQNCSARKNQPKNAMVTHYSNMTPNDKRMKFADKKQKKK